jgi:hypothetical protein
MTIYLVIEEVDHAPGWPLGASLTLDGAKAICERAAETDGATHPLKWASYKEQMRGIPVHEAELKHTWLMIYEFEAE